MHPEYTPSSADLTEDWSGFIVAGGTVVCETCRCKIRRSVADAKVHRDWHSQIDAR
jgi:hypothetical protein